MSQSLSGRTVEEVLEHHIKYLAEGNLEEVLLDYNDDSYLINTNGIVIGKDALKEFFRDSIENCLPPDTKQTIEVKRIHGELAYIVWKAESKYYHVPFGTDTFVIRGGKIIMQSFAGIMKRG